MNQRIEYNKTIRPNYILLIEKLADYIAEELEEFMQVNNYEDKYAVLNCGLAHGIVSKIILFSKFLEKEPENIVVNTVLKSCVTTLLNLESESEETVSRFPFIARKGEPLSYNSPLGWCYGDQTMASAFKMAAEVLNDQKLKTKALEIALHSAARDTISKVCASNNVDAGFCHGTSSIAFLNKKWFEISKNEKFRNSYHVFLRETLNRLYHKDIISGFKKNMGDEIGFKLYHGLLDGVCGVGVFLIDTVLKERIGWGKLFLLS